MKLMIPPESIRRRCGFGMVSCGDGYVFQPTRVEEIRDVLDLAKRSGRKIVQRGAGQSYGDANIGRECLFMDTTLMRRILSWDSQSGVLEAEAGSTVEDLWRKALPDGYWPPVVSGTMRPTLGGALSMNIHGKNNFCMGPIGEHVLELDIVDGRGRVRTLKPRDERFYAVIGGIGLLGTITRVKLQMKRLPSGDLRVRPICCKDLDDHFAAFEKFENDADYMVSWVDCFGHGSGLGRGLFHAAWHAEGAKGITLEATHQDLPDKVMGVLPKAAVWRYLKLFNNRFGMRGVNAAKYLAAKVATSRANDQSLVEFSFLLDYVPNWRRAYEPGGFIQYQSFVPKGQATTVFEKQIALQQRAGLEAFLGVLKRHRSDRFLLSHAVDGYSLALDFKVTERSWPRILELAHDMNDLVLSAGGRFYFAKDSTLRPEDVRAFLGEETLGRFEVCRQEFDPDRLFTSCLAERVGLA